MDLIFKFIAILYIPFGVVVASLGYAITIEAIPNPTSNPWIDMLFLCIGIFLICIGYISWTNNHG